MSRNLRNLRRPNPNDREFNEPVTASLSKLQARLSASEDDELDALVAEMWAAMTPLGGPSGSWGLALFEHEGQ